MTIDTPPAPPTTQQAPPPVTQASPNHRADTVEADNAGTTGAMRVRFGMRAKMLTLFTLVFTVIFVVIGLFVVNYVGNQAQAQLVRQLNGTAVGGATTIDAAAMVELRGQIPQASTAKFPKNFPLDNALYRRLCLQLVNITKLVPNASPYTYFRDPATGTVEWETTYAAFPPESWAAVYREPISGIVGANSETYNLMVKGLSTTVNQAPYADHSGAYNWISTYTPIRDASGRPVAGLGVDLPMQYVGVVRSGAIRGVLPILLVSYVIVFIMVLLLATFLTRPLKRLTVATARIADGDYDVDLSSVADTKIPDEMAVLSHSFALMVDKVKAREQKLTQQVKRLTVEIDASKRQKSVSEITDSDFFSGIVAKGKELRESMKEADSGTN